MSGKFSMSACALVAALAAAPCHAQEGDRLGELRRQALELVNESRVEAGLSRLVFDEVLNQAAQGHASDMLERDFYAHVTPDGETAFDRFLAAGGNRWSVAAENIAKCTGCTPPADAGRIEAFHEGWMQSPEHRDNILSEGFDRFGFGMAGEGNEIYAVQTFSGPGADSGNDDAQALTQAEIREAALEKINAARQSDDLDPLDLDPALDTLAEQLLQDILSGGSIPDDIFAQLPEGSTGWTSLALRSASRGGSGTKITRGEISTLIEDWRTASEAEPFGGTRATHLGWAARSDAEGRTTALAVFGGRR